MKKKDWQKLAQEDTAKVESTLMEWNTELTKLRHSKVVGKAANPSRIARVADDIARVKTVLRKRVLAGSQE